MQQFFCQLSRREFMVGSAALLLGGGTGCDQRGAAVGGAALGAAGAIISLPIWGPAVAASAALVGGLVTVTGGVISVVALLLPDDRSSEPDYRTFSNVSSQRDTSVPSGRLRILDSTTSRDVTGSFFINPSTQGQIPGSLSGTMTRLHYRVPRTVTSLPFSHPDITTLKHRAAMFGIPCAEQPTPVGGGRFTIVYGGIDWQNREFADRATAESWYRVFASAPGFEISLS